MKTVNFNELIRISILMSYQEKVEFLPKISDAGYKCLDLGKSKTAPALNEIVIETIFSDSAQLIQILNL